MTAARSNLPSVLHLLVLALPLSGAPGRLAEASDCNLNGVEDVDDIALLASADCDEDGVPDECELKARSYTAAGHTLGGRPRRVATGDLDADGYLDIVAARRTIVTTLRNRGDRGFDQSDRTTTDDALLALVTGDFDGDERLDVAAADTLSLFLLPGNGAGAVGPPVETAFAGVLALGAVDLDGDPFQDLVATRDGSVGFLRGTAGWTFEPVAEPVVPGTPSGLAVSDLDGDGDSDVAVVNGLSLFFVENRGGGEFETAEVPGLERGAENVLAADLDDDGLPELVVAIGDGLEVLPNLGDGSFESPSFLDSELSLEAALLAASDVDADGDMDVVSAVGGGVVLVAFLNAAGRLVSAREIIVGSFPADLVAGDLGGDRGQELVFAALTDRTVGVVWTADVSRSGQTGLELEPFDLNLHQSFEPHSSATGDLDGDDDTDLVTMNGENSVLVVANDGEGGFVLGEPLTVSGALEIIALAAADLDGDDDLDVMAVDEATRILAFLFNRGDGTFAQGENQDLSSRPFHVHAADLDGDELREVVSVNEGGGTVQVFLNRGGGVFNESADIPVGPSPRSAASGDFDGDGDRDLAVAVSSGSELVVLWNDGGAEFPSRDTYPVVSPSSVAAGDFDGAGGLDLVVAGRGPGRVTLFRNQGDGTFAEGEETPAPAGPNVVILPDIDGDGRIDAVTANPDSNSISVLLQRDGSLAEPLDFPVGGEPRFVVQGDLDGDGFTDLAAANHDSFDFTVFFRRSVGLPYDEEICSEEDYYNVASRAGDASPWETVFTLPVDAAAAALIPPLFQDTARYAGHEVFLGTIFPSVVPPGSYVEKVVARETRRYFGGALRRLETAAGPVYGFTLHAAEAEPPSEDEARGVYEALRAVFHLEPLAYAPSSGAAVQAARGWAAPSFPVYLGDFADVRFRRADVDGNGTAGLGDVTAILDYIFLNGSAPACLKTADANDDGDIDISDPLLVLFALYLERGTVADPYPGCGVDPSSDLIPCAAYAACE
jgi:hypothetical protein